MYSLYASKKAQHAQVDSKKELGQTLMFASVGFLNLLTYQSFFATARSARQKGRGQHAAIKGLFTNLVTLFEAI